MAYTRVLGTCPVCGEPATVEVVNRFNAPCGRYCEKHGKAKAETMTKTENDRK